MTINREAAELMALRLTNAVDAAHTFAEALRLATVALQEPRDVPEVGTGFGEARIGITRVRGFVAWDTGSEQPLFFYINGRGEQTATTDWSDFVPDPDTAALRAEVERLTTALAEANDARAAMLTENARLRERIGFLEAVEERKAQFDESFGRERESLIDGLARAEARLARVTVVNVRAVVEAAWSPLDGSDHMRVNETVSAVLALVAADEQAAEGEFGHTPVLSPADLARGKAFAATVGLEPTPAAPVTRDRLDELVAATYRSGADTRHLVVIAVLDALGIEVDR